MNFKTTIVLIVLLAIVGGVVIYHRSTEKPVDVANTDQTDTAGRKLFDIASDQVSRIVITPKRGKQTVIEKSGGKWQMTAPVAARADESAVLGLITNLITLRSQGRPAGDVSSNAGLDHPRYIIEISGQDGKSQVVKIGAKNGSGDMFFAQAKRYFDDIDCVDASIDKPLAKVAADLRDKQLLQVDSYMLKQAQITTDKSTLAMVKFDDKWKVVSPAVVPGDSAEISSYLSDIGRMRAVEFVDPGSAEYPLVRFDRPTATVWLDSNAADAATTRPITSASQPAVTLNTTGGTTLIVGLPDTLAKENYYVKLADGTVAKVAASAVDGLKKTPLDLRDRAVVSFPSLDVKQISITKETYTQPQPATAPSTSPSTAPTADTQPSTKPVVLPPPKLLATTRTVLVRRPPPQLGPELPASRPTTQSTTANSQPATQPVKPEEQKSVWQLVSDPSANVDDAKVEQLLGQFSPLKASKYLPALTMEQALTRYTVQITLASGQVVTLKVFDSGSATPQALCQELIFELSGLVYNLNEDFLKSSVPAGNQPRFPPPDL